MDGYQWRAAPGWEHWPARAQRPLPAVYYGPKPDRPEVLTDCWRVALADPDGHLIGIPAHAPAVARTLTASRSA